MNKETKNTLMKVADYAENSKERLAKKMCDMTAGTLILFGAYLVMHYTGLADSARPYQNLSEVALGLTLATLVLNILYCSGLLEKIKAVKVSFFKKNN